MSYTRFAIYHVPHEGALASFAASWLGWDVSAGVAVAHMDLPGLVEITSTPRKYGFHGTLKPPFRLAVGCTPEALALAVQAMAAACPPAQADGLQVSRLGHFLALTPVGDASGIARIAATCVADLDGFRAPPSEAELARRRKATLSLRQKTLLARWGYPFVMDQFRFHMTLSGRLPPAELDRWAALAEAHLPPLPAPFVLDEVALVGERADGRFEMVRRFPLSG